MSKQFANIHDAFFKQVLSDPNLAGTFLSEHLPPDVANLLDPASPEPVPGSFVDEELRQHHSDLLFRVRLKGGRDAFAYVLMEHKSSPDPGARLQLLRYVVRMLVHWYDQNKQQLPLPLVLPLLAHQGPEGWTLSCEFADLFGSVPEPLRPYLPSFRHALVDLPLIDDRALSAEARLRAFLKALKYSRRPELPDCIDLVLAEAPGLEEKDLLVILTYLDRGSIALDNKVMHEALQRLVPDRKERIMGWLTQPYYDKGKAEGRAEGRAEGEARGEAKILARLLEIRFGAIPAALHQRIFAADVASIETWVERAFEAPDLQSVFDSN
jgi:predicted transposase/invertase (TIGR01784 family)